MRHTLAAFIALSLASPTLAQAPANPWHSKGRALFSDIIAIPSVTDRTGEVKRTVAYLKAKFEAGGITNVVVKDHDGTQSMIVRWSAEPPKKGEEDQGARVETDIAPRSYGCGRGTARRLVARSV